MAAEALLGNRGMSMKDPMLIGEYNAEISDIPKQISVLKAVRLFCIVLFLLSLVVKWTLFNFEINPSPGKIHILTNRIFFLGGLITALLTVYFSAKIEKLKEKLRSEKIILGSNPIDNLFSALHISGEG